MNLNDLIAKEGEKFLHTIKLDLSKLSDLTKNLTGSIDSIKGIERLNYIEQITIDSETAQVIDLDLLNTPNLQKTVKSIKILGEHETSDKPIDISFISEYMQVEELLILTNIKNIDVLCSPNLQKTIKKLGVESSRLKNLSFLTGYKQLELLYVGLRTNEYLKDLNQLATPNLEKTIKNLRITSTCTDMSFLTKYKKLEGLTIISPAFEDASQLTALNLEKTIKRLSLTFTQVKDFSFLKGYKQLEQIEIMSDVGTRAYDLNQLATPNLEKTIKKLYLTNNNLTNISFLSKYRKLEELSIMNSKQINDWSPLVASNLQKTIKKLDLEQVNLRDISFLSEYQKLEEIKIRAENVNITDWNPLNSNKLKKTIKELDIAQTNFQDISLIKEYQKLEQLDLYNTLVKDISEILNYEFVRNGSLKEISLGDEINWSKTVNGRYVNGEVVQELKRRGIEVILPYSFKYNPQKISTKEEKAKLILRKYSLSEDLIEKTWKTINEHDTMQKLEGGFSSKIILASPKEVVKIAGKEASKNEQKIYSLELNQMKKFIPQIKDFLELDNTGLMVLSNVNAEDSGFKKSGIYDPILHNLYLMGLFHKEATKATKQQQIIIRPYEYTALTGQKHVDALAVPMPHFTKTQIEQYREDTPFRLIQQIKPILTEAEQFIREGASSIVHGDWKIQNTPNAHIVDFGITHPGKELEDITYFLSHINLQLTTEQKQHYLEQYVKLRSTHDQEFRENSQKHHEMKEYFNQVMLLQQTVFASVRNKRPQTPENTLVRQYYIQNMKETTHNIILI